MSPQYGPEHLGLVNLLRRYFEEILVDDNKICGLAGLDGDAGEVVADEEVCGAWHGHAMKCHACHASRQANHEMTEANQKTLLCHECFGQRRGWLPSSRGATECTQVVPLAVFSASVCCAVA